MEALPTRSSEAYALAPPKRILVVDDDPAIRAVLAAFLEMEGYQVAPARDGRDALLKAKLERPDLVVLDLMMPSMSGWGFLSEQAKDPTLAGIPVVVASSFTCRLKVAAHLQKPYGLETLLATIRRLAA
ncbi:MAG TPA: response regulator [Anaeromyxobacteraceae bacterium]|nr:response regulator [Anaeromyxobacteraceae bacterium]